MNTRGIPSYIPVLSVGADHKTVHVLSRKELKELFEQVDSYKPAGINPADFRMAREYPLMFRLYYCCGMRNNEVCMLETTDADLKNGIITVRDGKNRKDRLVYLPEDLRILLEKYLAYITKELAASRFICFREGSRKRRCQKAILTSGSTLSGMQQRLLLPVIKSRRFTASGIRSSSTG